MGMSYRQEDCSLELHCVTAVKLYENIISDVDSIASVTSQNCIYS
jgi:hypothetical protein